MKTDATQAIPTELLEALATDKVARCYFDALAPSCRKEHAGYVAEGKKPETRRSRAEKTVATLRHEANQKK